MQEIDTINNSDLIIKTHYMETKTVSSLKTSRTIAFILFFICLLVLGFYISELFPWAADNPEKVEVPQEISITYFISIITALIVIMIFCYVVISKATTKINKQK